MYPKRKIRAEKKKNNAQENSTKVNLNCDIGINGNHLESVEKSTFIQRISSHF